MADVEIAYLVLCWERSRSRCLLGRRDAIGWPCPLWRISTEPPIRRATNKRTFWFDSNKRNVKINQIANSRREETSVAYYYMDSDSRSGDGRWSNPPWWQSNWALDMHVTGSFLEESLCEIIKKIKFCWINFTASINTILLISILKKRRDVQLITTRREGGSGWVAEGNKVWARRIMSVVKMHQENNLSSWRKRKTKALDNKQVRKNQSEEGKKRLFFSSFFLVFFFPFVCIAFDNERTKKEELCVKSLYREERDPFRHTSAGNDDDDDHQTIGRYIGFRSTWVPPIIPERVFEQRTSSMLMRRAILSIPLIL